MNKEHDPVNHPSHYTSHPSGVECIDITKYYNFCLGNVIKYVWRNGLKDGVSSIQDLKKAQWYLNCEIERLEKEQADAEYECQMQQYENTDYLAEREKLCEQAKEMLYGSEANTNFDDDYFK